MSQRRELLIERLGRRGEGVARTPDGPVFVAYALPGESIIADVDGERGSLVEVLRPSADRIAPFCPYYGDCGGCAIQNLAASPYAAWKRALLVDALAREGLAPPVAPLIDAHGAGRRRATFHARIAREGGARRVQVGYMRARAHTIVEITQCPILAPGLARAPLVAHALAELLAEVEKPLDILVTETDGGLDADIRGTGPLTPARTRKLVAAAESLDLARLSNHGEVLVERRAPTLDLGGAEIVLPPGGFLQATRAGEEVIAGLVTDAVRDARAVADLFCGAGPFALRLARRADVLAVENEPRALVALERAARRIPGLRPVTTERRDLFRRPLAGAELAGFDAVVFDPPRAGAQAQAQALAASATPTVVAVSCNPSTFARDARILIEGGYRFERATAVDQFRHSPHVEAVGVFNKAPVKSIRRKRMLG